MYGVFLKKIAPLAARPVLFRLGGLGFASLFLMGGSGGLRRLAFYDLLNVWFS
jgi:hypothetical protein